MAIIKLVASTHPEKVEKLESVVADATTFVMNQLLAEETLGTEEEDLPVFCLRSVELLDIPKKADLKKKSGRSSSSVSSVSSARI